MNENAVQISAERLPYIPQIEDRFGIDRASWRALTDAVFPTAKTVEGVILALSYCRARNLDVFKRPVHIVPMWNQALGREVETVWPGIGELRITAFRTKMFAGNEPCEFGDMQSATFTGEIGRGNYKKDVSVQVDFPEWAQCAVYRLIAGQRVKITGPRVYWREIYSSIGQSGVPNDRWQRAPRGQIEKCAEAAALRRAFPEECGEYTADEMEGKEIEGAAVIEVKPPPPAVAKPKRRISTATPPPPLPAPPEPPADYAHPVVDASTTQDYPPVVDDAAEADDAPAVPDATDTPDDTSPGDVTSAPAQAPAMTVTTDQSLSPITTDDASLTNTITWKGARVKTGGVSPVTLAKLCKAAREYDSKEGEGAWLLLAEATCEGVTNVFQLTEEEARQVLIDLMD